MKHISKKRQPVDGLLMILIFSLVFSGLFQVVLAFSNQGVADVMTFNYVWATTPIDNIFHLAFRCLVWVSGSGGGGAGRVVWGYGYHVVVHRRPATA